MNFEETISRYILTDVMVDSVIITEELFAERNLDEARQINPIIPGTRYTYRIDIPFGEQRPGNQKHIHVLAKNGDELFAMNVDGTAHDGYHKVQIPQDVRTFLFDKGFTLPPNNIIEFYTSTQNTSRLLIMENETQSSPWSKLVPKVCNIICESTKFQIIESNLPIAEVKMYLISDFTHFFKINVPCQKIDTLKDILINTFKKYTHFINDIIQKNEDSNAKHQLFIAWECISGFQYEVEEVF